MFVRFGVARLDPEYIDKRTHRVHVREKTRMVFRKYAKKWLCEICRNDATIVRY